MTTAINLKPIYAGLFISALVILLFSTVTITKPDFKVKPLTKTENMQFIYRGIPIGHPGYTNAMMGISAPMGGNNKAWQHREGQTNSPFTSWTTNLSVAYRYATTGFYGPCDGVILVKKVNLNNDRFVDMEKEPGGNAYNESEILIKGLMNGCIPIVVKQNTSYNDLLNIIKSSI
jgi:hypothetical protein